MAFIIGLLTFILVLDCLALILLVLIQLPKKEAGAGLAFGGGATDALFGSGSGTVLTKITKYAAALFLSLAVILAILQRNYLGRRGTDFQRMLEASGKPPAVAPAIPPSVTPGSTTTNVSIPPLVSGATNVPAPAGTAPVPESP